MWPALFESLDQYLSVTSQLSHGVRGRSRDRLRECHWGIAPHPDPLPLGEGEGGASFRRCSASRPWPGGRWGRAFLGEEGAEEGGGIGFPHTPHHLRNMVAGRCGEHPRAMLHATAFRVVSAKNQFADTGEGNGLGAHGAGFQGDVEVAADQPGGADGGGRGANGQKLGMRGGVMVHLRPVARLGQDGAVRPDDHGADRHFPPRGGFLGFLQGDRHPLHANFLPAHGARV